MSWRAAFLRQARSDQQIRRLLDRPDVEYSHRLHYLQMVTEKLAKGMMASDTLPPPQTHQMFVRVLQTLKRNPVIRRQLEFTDAAIFRKYIDSLLPLAAQIERLAPSAARGNEPNPEYPWWDADQNQVQTPAEFNFALFDPSSARMNKLESLLRSLFRIVE